MPATVTRVRSAKCLCGHVQASHAPWSEYAGGSTQCAPTRGKRQCRCRGFDPIPESPLCPLDVAGHRWCLCVPGQVPLW